MLIQPSADSIAFVQITVNKQAFLCEYVAVNHTTKLVSLMPIHFCGTTVTIPLISPMSLNVCESDSFYHVFFLS